jgi:hypothetical protein
MDPRTDGRRRDGHGGRLGVAAPDGGRGREDPRVTFVELLASYVMSYTAFSPEGPR